MSLRVFIIIAAIIAALVGTGVTALRAKESPKEDEKQEKIIGMLEEVLKNQEKILDDLRFVKRKVW